jgi:hypothetical protein
MPGLIGWCYIIAGILHVFGGPYGPERTWAPYASWTAILLLIIAGLLTVFPLK